MCSPNSKCLPSCHQLVLLYLQVPAYAAFLQDQQQQHKQTPTQEQQQEQQQGAPCSEADGAAAAQATPPARGAAAAASWQGVPFTTKQNYFHAFPLPARCVGGPSAGLGATDFVHTSSGSSGAPTLWARNVFDELAVCTR